VNREATAAFAQVYDDEVWSVYGFFGYRVRSREEAEDLTQLTFERAFRSRSGEPADLAAGDRAEPPHRSLSKRPLESPGLPR
jgi:DNA-directed RNA polymerase specialized sigma24 family protein